MSTHQYAQVPPITIVPGLRHQTAQLELWSPTEEVAWKEHCRAGLNALRMRIEALEEEQRRLEVIEGYKARAAS